MMTKTSVKFELILMLMFVPRERERERERGDPEVWFIKTWPQTRGPSRVVSPTPGGTERED